VVQYAPYKALVEILREVGCETEYQEAEGKKKLIRILDAAAIRSDAKNPNDCDSGKSKLPNQFANLVGRLIICVPQLRNLHGRLFGPVVLGPLLAAFLAAAFAFRTIILPDFLIVRLTVFTILRVVDFFGICLSVRCSGLTRIRRKFFV
jgi:hypothetical protein